MKLLTRLLALFVFVPIVELALLIRIGQWLGLLPTVLMVVVTGVVGAMLARREGLRTVSRMRQELSGGRFPVGRMLDGALILFAGGLLLTPGVLTDVVGLALLAPLSRGWVKRLLAERVKAAVAAGRTSVTIHYDDPPPPGRAL
jgi:UPF0716 protein FxsA